MGATLAQIVEHNAHDRLWMGMESRPRPRAGAGTPTSRNDRGLGGIRRECPIEGGTP